MTSEDLSKGDCSVDHRPVGDKWVFDSTVVACFDDMLDKSIPHHGVMRDLIVEIAAKFIRPHSVVLDLGCSLGRCLFDLAANADMEHVRFIGVDSMPGMVEGAQDRLARLPQEIQNRFSISQWDLRQGIPPSVSSGEASVVFLVLTLQFVPSEYRQKIIHQIYQALDKGSVLLLVEKVLGEGATVQDLMVDRYHALKGNSGYSSDSIEAKRKSLEGVLNPVVPSEHQRMLNAAGFSEVDCFWRWMNFAGWVAVK